MSRTPTAAEIRQTFIDFFVQRGHTFVPSSSLVPGGDSTLLFTNAGMVQFKDVFLGTDKRPYTRAVNSQKCLRVAGKHNDLEDVGRDDFHHTFFEMLGNWSFGDYYKQEALSWAWELLTEVWGLPKDRLYVTCFKDELGVIPTDEEAAEVWRKQPGLNPDHILFFGRKENFWEMAETGPCGPCSEIHIDRGPEYCNLKGQPHRCTINGDCLRYMELWNNVFIQYNRLDENTLEPLPARHVDTGMGFERLVSVLQGVDSNYKIDLFRGVLDTVRALTGDSTEQMYANFTPYRVIADHVRAAVFLIADGVVPGNVGRNYICRMIIRRAARFGAKLGLHEPFLAKAAEAIIAAYGDHYHEVVANQSVILDNLTREELRFARTIESGSAFLQGLLDEQRRLGERVLAGEKAFDLYATYGLPFEIARDIAREQGMDVDEDGFRRAMEEHRLASGGGKAMGKLGGEDAELYTAILQDLQKAGKIGETGVEHNPYEWSQVEGEVLALVNNGQAVEQVGMGDKVEVLLPRTGFYVESGGQVSDTGWIRARDGSWEIEVQEMRKPAAGVIVHVGEVAFGRPRRGDAAIAQIDEPRRRDIMRNHTATHLLHAALRQVLGEHARQAGSLVAPDRLRFDFNHPEALTPEQLERVERIVNEAIAADLPVAPRVQKREEAIAAGAMALFGEKYGEIVRAVVIAPQSDESPLSYELCGGTHLERTSDAGMFLITSEGSAAAGVRRIEAVTGRGAYELVNRRFRLLQQTAAILKAALEETPQRVEQMQQELSAARKQIASLKTALATAFFDALLNQTEAVKDVCLLTGVIEEADKETLGKLADRFRERYPQRGVCALATISGEQITVMAAVTRDLIQKGIKAGDLAAHISRQLGAGGGGAPHLAFGGGRDLARLPEVLAGVRAWLEAKL